MSSIKSSLYSGLSDWMACAHSLLPGRCALPPRPALFLAMRSPSAGARSPPAASPVPSPALSSLVVPCLLAVFLSASSPAMPRGPSPLRLWPTCSPRSATPCIGSLRCAKVRLFPDTLKQFLFFPQNSTRDTVVFPVLPCRTSCTVTPIRRCSGLLCLTLWIPVLHSYPQGIFSLPPLALLHRVFFS